MTYIIYADVLFVLNFSIDLLCMCVSLYICRLKRRIFALISACAVGGIYAVLSVYFQDVPLLLKMLIHICVMIIICAISTPSRNSKTVLKVSAVFFFTVSLGGSAVTTMFSYLGKYTCVNGMLYANVSFPFLILFFLFALILSLPFFIQSRNKKTEKSVSVSVRFKNSSISFDAFSDSGNLLKDPLSGDGIILIKDYALLEIFTKKQLEAIKELDVLSDDFPTGIRLIPWEKGVIPIMRPMDVTLKLYGRKEKSSVSALIGIDFSGGSFGGTAGLIPSYYI